MIHKKENIYNENVYTNINIENLILFGIYRVSNGNETCTFERLVAECFINFPKVFTFKRYPNWPDSLRFDRPLRKLREKGMIAGSVKDHLLLTKFGEQKAIETKKILEEIKVPAEKDKKTEHGERSIDDRLISHLKNNTLFQNYIKDPTNFSISESEFRNILRCTLETPVRILKQNLIYYKKLTNLYKEKLLCEFLLFCENKFLKNRGN